MIHDLQIWPALFISGISFILDRVEEYYSSVTRTLAVVVLLCRIPKAYNLVFDETRLCPLSVAFAVFHSQKTSPFGDNK